MLTLKDYWLDYLQPFIASFERSWARFRCMRLDDFWVGNALSSSSSSSETISLHWIDQWLLNISKRNQSVRLNIDFQVDWFSWSSIFRKTIAVVVLLSV
ncbi:hypothetical protein SDJN03_02231, partial [Cucurbita argyrosperma subsp. sororia]